MAHYLTDPVLEAIRTARVDGNQVALTCGQMEKKDFDAFKQAMQAIAGAWVGGKTQAHVFGKGIDPGPLLDQLISTKQVPKQNPFSLFPSSNFVIDSIFDMIGDEFDYMDHRPLRVLEPSGGTGNIAIRLMEKYPNLDLTVVEIDPLNCARMAQRGIETVCMDFLDFKAGDFDLIVMNPPFDGIECAKHFNHAYELLGNGSLLICVLPDMVRSKTRTEAVGRMIDRINIQGFTEELPDGSFLPATNVETFVARVRHMQTPDNRADRLIMQCCTDRHLQNKLDRLYQKTAHVQTDLFGNPADTAFFQAIRRLHEDWMAREKGFLKLTESEWAEVDDHYFQYYKEAKKTGRS